MIHLKVIHPADFHGSPHPGRGKIAEALREACLECEPIKTLGHAETRIGIVIVRGQIEDLDFRNTNTYARAAKCDGLAVWFHPDATVPQRDSVLRIDIDQCFNAAEQNCYDIKLNPFLEEQFHFMPEMVKLLIGNAMGGMERQLMRRVWAIGTRLLFPQEVEGAYGPETVAGTTYKWILVPKNRFRRAQTKQEPIGEVSPQT